jgi:hypothetical protein
LINLSTMGDDQNVDLLLLNVEIENDAVVTHPKFPGTLEILTEPVSIPMGCGAEPLFNRPANTLPLIRRYGWQIVRGDPWVIEDIPGHLAAH